MSADERQPTVLCPVGDLREGWQVDLAGDPYADPDRDHPAFESEFETVWTAPVVESAECIAVGFGFDVVGFPPDHRVPVRVYEVES